MTLSPETHRIDAPQRVTQPGSAESAADGVDVAGLGQSLLGRWADVRRESRKLAARAEFAKIEGLTMADHRERVLGQLHALVEHGQVLRAFSPEIGGHSDHGGNLAAFEELVFADPSLQIKSGVQWGLFAAAILHLGTAEHHARLLPAAARFEIPGVFAMTETGHGSDVASIATTATYLPETGEFDLHTPHRAAWKDYLGNAALHGQAAVVFAQLITGGENHGVHAFYVPIRRGTTFLPGVGGVDDGLKGGLNGIDNGRLHFTHVRVPRENLLDRYGHVAADGSYSSPIASPGRRFFTMLGTLVQGRVSLDGAATNAAALALTIAIRYGLARRQFDRGDGTEQVLLDYRRHQRRLLPLLATCYAQFYAHEELLERFDAVFSGAADSDEDRQDLETHAAALKPLSTWNALRTIQECRESCGGQGFLAENQLVGLYHDLDVYVTFEGDNTVLLQLVAKRLLADYAAKFAGASPRAMASYLVGELAERAVSGSGLRRLAQIVADRGSTARAVNEVRDPQTQHELLADRVETMIASAAMALRDVRKLGPSEAAAAFNEQQDQLIRAAQAHGELLQWEAFSRVVTNYPDAATRQVLVWLRDLFGLELIERNAAWYLMNGRLSASRVEAISAYINRLLERLRPHVGDLVAAFGLEPDLVRAPIVTEEAERQREAQAAAHAKDPRS